MSDKTLEKVANYLCELDRQVNVTKAPFAHSNPERRAMFLVRAEDLFRSVPELTASTAREAALREALEVAEAKAIRLHVGLGDLLYHYKGMVKDTNSEPMDGEAIGIEVAERQLFDNAPLADWERHLPKPPAAA